MFDFVVFIFPEGSCHKSLVPQDLWGYETLEKKDNYNIFQSDFKDIKQYSFCLVK